jgi:hypothetical protein
MMDESQEISQNGFFSAQAPSQSERTINPMFGGLASINSGMPSIFI